MKMNVGESTVIKVPFWKKGMDVQHEGNILSIDRIPPTLENFRFGSYPLMTTYYLTVPENPTDDEQKLIDYLWSRKFAARLYRAGLLPEQRKRNDEKTAPAKNSGRSGF